MAEKISVARFRNILLTQGSADAFKEATEMTGLDPASGQAWLLKRLEVSFAGAVGLQAISADSEIGWSLSRDSKAAMSNLLDSDIIHQNGIFASLTTSGQVLVPGLYEYEFPDGVLVVEPEIFAQLDSTSTGLTLTAHMRLYYETVKLSEVDILRMLTQG